MGAAYQNTLDNLKQNNKIFAIGITDAPKEDLINLASVMDDKLLLFKFNDFESLARVSSYIESKYLDGTKGFYKCN